MKTTKTIKSMMIAVALLCGASMNVNAQSYGYYDTKNDVSVSVGYFSNSQIFDAFSDIGSVMGEVLGSGLLSGGQFVGTTSYDNKTVYPAISAEYTRHLNKIISVGVIGAFNGSKSDMFCNWKDNTTGTTTKKEVGTANKFFISVLPTVKFDWLRKKNFGMYSKLAVGATFWSERQKVNEGNKEVAKDNGVFFAFQASLVGAEIGAENLRAFVELGVGEQGMASMGLRYKF